MAIKKYSNSKPSPSYRGDMKFQLAAIAKQMAAEDPSYSIAKQQQQFRINRNWAKLMDLTPILYEFLRGYKFNSGIFINNFFRKRTYAQYVEDIWDEFTMNVFAKDNPFSFGNDVYSLSRSTAINRYLHELDKNRTAYHPINCTMIRLLETLEDAFELHPPVERVDQVLYRGCTTLERNGLNGIVSTSADMAIALQFSRGTLLIIEVPEGTHWIDVAKIRARKRNAPTDFENEFLLRMCKYEIISEETIPKGSWGDEPNNHKSETKVIRVRVLTTLDLLEEFLKVMENPPEEFMQVVYPHIKADFEEAKELMKTIIKQRKTRKKR